MVTMQNTTNFFDSWSSSQQKQGGTLSPKWGSDARGDPHLAQQQALHRAWEQQQQQALGGSGRKTADELMQSLGSWGKARDSMPAFGTGLLGGALDSPTLLGGLGVGGPFGVGPGTQLTKFTTMNTEHLMGRSADTSPPPLEAMPREPLGAPTIPMPGMPPSVVAPLARATDSPRIISPKAGSAAQPLRKPPSPSAAASPAPARTQSLLSKPKSIQDPSGAAFIEGYLKAFPQEELKALKFFDE